MVSEQNLNPTLSEVLAVVADLPVDDKVELAQWLIGEESVLRVVVDDYPHNSLVERIKRMNRSEIGEILEAVAKYLTLEEK